MAGAAEIREYYSVDDFADDAEAWMADGWKPVSLSSTLRRNFLWYLTLGMAPRATVYQVLWVEERTPRRPRRT